MDFPSSPEISTCYPPCSISRPNTATLNIPDDMVSILIDFICDKPLDYLSLMMVSKQFKCQVSSKLQRYCSVDNIKSESLLDAEHAPYFSSWGHLSLGQKPHYVSWRGSGPCYYCRNCKLCILTRSNVESDQYQGG